MSYRAWPAALLTGVALTAACVVVGEHVVQTRDGCLDPTGWFTATPAAWPGDEAAISVKRAAEPDKARSGVPGTVHEAGETDDQQNPGDNQISGCLDLDRIEVPAPGPDPDSRA